MNNYEQLKNYINYLNDKIEYSKYHYNHSPEARKQIDHELGILKLIKEKMTEIEKEGK